MSKSKTRIGDTEEYKVKVTFLYGLYSVPGPFLTVPRYQEICPSMYNWEDVGDELLVYNPYILHPELSKNIF